MSRLKLVLIAVSVTIMGALGTMAVVGSLPSTSAHSTMVGAAASAQSPLPKSISSVIAANNSTPTTQVSPTATINDLEHSLAKSWSSTDATGTYMATVQQVVVKDGTWSAMLPGLDALLGAPLDSSKLRADEPVFAVVQVGQLDARNINVSSPTGGSYKWEVIVLDGKTLQFEVALGGPTASWSGFLASLSDAGIAYDRATGTYSTYP